MAYRIAVLDDDGRELHKTEEMLSRYGETHPQYTLQITCFQEIKPFMDAVCGGAGEEERAFDVLLMDVYLPDGNGIDSAKILREKGYEGVIIFKSSSPDDMVEAYFVNALCYLMKPVSQEELDRAMDKAVKEIRRHAEELAGERKLRHAEELTGRERKQQPAGGVSEKESGSGKPEVFPPLRDMVKKILTNRNGRPGRRER